MRSASLSAFLACLSVAFTLPTIDKSTVTFSSNILPRGPGKTCSNGINNGKQLADTTYPGQNNPSTCPDHLDPNPWEASLVGHDKRSLIPATALTTLNKRQQPSCVVIARQIFDHYIPDNHRIANTQQIHLIRGLGYVFSMSTCALVDQINIYLNTGNYHFDRVQNVHIDDTRTSVSFTVPQNGDYHVEVTFRENIFQDGALRLYEIGGP